MDILNALLEADPSKVKIETKEVRIKSLSELTKKDALFTIRQLTNAEFSDIQSQAVDVSSKGEITGLNTNETQLSTCLAGIVSPDLKNEQLQKHYRAATPKELLIKLLKSGEIASIADMVRDISGFGEDAVEEVKNELTQTVLQG